MTTDRETTVNQPSARRSPLVILLLLLIPVAFIGGCMTTEPLAGAGVAAGVFSLTVGLLLVAPLAGRWAKQNLLNALANPTEEDQQLIQGTVLHIIGNAGVLARNPETRVLFQPLFDAYTEALDVSWNAILNNKKQQMVRDRGPFNPDNISEEEMEEIGREFEGMMFDRIAGFIDPILDKWEFTERGKQIAHAKLLMAIRQGPGGSGSGRGGPHPPRISPGTKDPYSYHR